MAYELNYCRINVPRHCLILNKKIYTKKIVFVYRKLSHLKFKKKRDPNLNQIEALRQQDCYGHFEACNQVR